MAFTGKSTLKWVNPGGSTPHIKDCLGNICHPCPTNGKIDFSEGWVMVRSDKGLYNFADRNASLISEEWFADATPFSEGVAAVRRQVKQWPHFSHIHFYPRRSFPFEIPHWEFIDRKGNFLPCETEFFEAGMFSGGTAPVSLLSSVGYVDKSLNPISKDWWKFVSPFSEGFSCVCDEEGRWNFMGKDGKRLCEGWWENVGAFSEGRACVKKGGLWNFIDDKGALISDKWWDEVSPFSGGRALVKDGESPMKVVDISGNVTAESPEDFLGKTEPTIPVSDTAILESSSLDKEESLDLEKQEKWLLGDYFIKDLDLSELPTRALKETFQRSCFRDDKDKWYVKASDIADSLEALGVKGIRRSGSCMVWVPLQRGNYTIMDGAFGFPTIGVGAEAWTVTASGPAQSTALRLIHMDSLLPRIRESAVSYRKGLEEKARLKELEEENSIKRLEEARPAVTSLLQNAGFDEFALDRDRKGCVGVTVRLTEERAAKLYIRYSSFQSDLDKVVPALNNLKKVLSELDPTLSINGISKRDAEEWVKGSSTQSNIP